MAGGTIRQNAKIDTQGPGFMAGGFKALNFQHTAGVRVEHVLCAQSNTFLPFLKASANDLELNDIKGLTCCCNTVLTLKSSMVHVYALLRTIPRIFHPDIWS